MQRIEICNAKHCAHELLGLGQVNMKMWYLFEWLTRHDELRHGTQAEMVKLYVDDILVAYSLLENYEACVDKTKLFNGILYRDLGVVHFVTMPKYRNKGYASLLANEMFRGVIEPLLARHTEVHAYITATERAVPLMQRTGIKGCKLVTQFYSDLSFEDKVVKCLHAKS